MWFVWILIGLIGGVLGGMGMGGGTLLIPLLTGLGGVSQHAAQTANLVSFIPMSVIALWIHSRNGFIKPKGVVWLIVSACAASAVFALIAQGLHPAVLKRSFGIFLAVLGTILLTIEAVRGIKKIRSF